ncbi:MAG: hydrogenase subunit MbhD domain-containing protein [Acholeplasma sp.]
MNEWLPLALQILLIFIAITIVLHKRNFTIIILISAFSLVAATLYTLNNAPDVAIAEVAIGSAIIPLIYIISISRQREFIILDKTHTGFIAPDEKLEGIVYDVLDKFVKANHLKLNICCDIEGDEEDLTSELNVDLVLSVDPKTKKFVIKGKESSLLVGKLSKMVEKYDMIEVIAFEESDLYD